MPSVIAVKYFQCMEKLASPREVITCQLQHHSTTPKIFQTNRNLSTTSECVSLKTVLNSEPKNVFCGSVGFVCHGLKCKKSLCPFHAVQGVSI